VRRLVVCADDFGLNAGVDLGILRLAGAGRITATSCLAGSSACVTDAGPLRATGVEVGLHLDLTDGTDGAPVAGLGGLIALSHLGAVDRAALRRRVARQLDAFERALGRAPAFVDGHRHVHQLPVVRDALLAELVDRYPGRAPAVRVTVPRRWRGTKAAIISALGGGALRRALRRLGVPHNADFCGVYGFQAGAPYRALVQGWLGTLEDGGLLMCHPGQASPDPLSAAREAELGYLASADFEADCAAGGFRRVGFGALAG